MEENKKSAFLSKMEEIAKQCNEMVKDGKKGLIIIAADSDENTTGTIICVAGSGLEISKGIAEFATQEQTKPLFMQGLKLASLKNLESVFDNINSNNKES